MCRNCKQQPDKVFPVSPDRRLGAMHFGGISEPSLVDRTPGRHAFYVINGKLPRITHDAIGGIGCPINGKELFDAFSFLTSILKLLPIVLPTEDDDGKCDAGGGSGIAGQEQAMFVVDLRDARRKRRRL